MVAVLVHQLFDERNMRVLVRYVPAYAVNDDYRASSAVPGGLNHPEREVYDAPYPAYHPARDNRLRLARGVAVLLDVLAVNLYGRQLPALKDSILLEKRKLQHLGP